MKIGNLSTRFVLFIRNSDTHTNKQTNKKMNNRFLAKILFSSLDYP